MNITHRTEGRSRRPVMTSRRWLGLAVSAAAAASVITASTSAMAASGGTPGTNNRIAPVAASHRPAAPQGSTPAATVVHYYSLAASAFAPDGLHNTTADYFNQWDPTTLSNQDSGRCFNAGLSLPNGATLKSVTVYYTAGSAPMFFEINQQDLANHTLTQLTFFDTAAATTPTYTSTFKTFAAGTGTHMITDTYSAGVCPSTNTTFSGLTIAYTG